MIGRLGWQITPLAPLLPLLLLLLFLSCQLSYKKKRKVERSPLCEEFIERASRPQELITLELLEVSTDSALTVQHKQIHGGIPSNWCWLSLRRSCPTSTSSMRSSRLLSLRHQNRRFRPSTWSRATLSRGCAALWWISTSGSKGR